MKALLTIIILLGAVAIGVGKEKNKNEGLHVCTPICYASGKVNKSFIGSPVKLKSATVNPSTIVVDYIDFPDDARQAFQYAVDIWQGLIYSPIPIHVKASWVSLGTNVLGSSRPADYYKNFNATQIWDRHYPVALAEKMYGGELNQPGDYEIKAQFNKDFGNWYFGTDGDTPSDQYDFVSVVLHELAHGLGFTGNFYWLRGTGGYASMVDELPAVFDEYVVNENGEKLVDSDLFPNPSKELSVSLLSDALEFDSRLSDGYLPKLYAPTRWNSGSSIYHLDEDTYFPGENNSLMTPYSDQGEAIHNPGPYTLNMMYDIGWKSISIKHKEIKDMESIPGPIVFDAQIRSDFELNTSKIYLIYSSNNFAKKDSVLLNATSIANHYSTQLSYNQFGSYQYYFAATDSKNRRYIYPSGSPGRAFNFKIGPDNEAPVINFQPIKFMLESDPSVKIIADVADNLGLQSVIFQYFVNTGVMIDLELHNDSNDVYSGLLSFPAGSIKEGDEVSYKIVAKDASLSHNIGRYPESGYNTFRIERIGSPVEQYLNNFDTPTNDFISVDFKIETPTGFDNPGLNSAHPYVSPNKDNTNLNFETLLKYPIILKAGSKISYDEIVLVEPGESGSLFGQTDFFDYVIVEGSNDGGKTWKLLTDGYDCSAQSSWLKLYNSGIKIQDSEAVPTKDLYVKREFGLLNSGSFNAGDVILVRFRLFSDPYASGWGWVIDNLVIQDFGTAVSPVLLSSGELEFYPNPASDELNLRIQAKNDIHKFMLKAYNSAGILVFSKPYSMDSNLFQTSISLNNFKSGLYLFAVEPENGKPITRKILIK